MSLWDGAVQLTVSRSVAAWLSDGFGMAGWVLRGLIRVVLTWKPFSCTEKVSVCCSVSTNGGINVFLSPVALCHRWMKWVEKLLGEEGEKRG